MAYGAVYRAPFNPPICWQYEAGCGVVVVTGVTVVVPGGFVVVTGVTVVVAGGFAVVAAQQNRRRRGANVLDCNLVMLKWSNLILPGGAVDVTGGIVVVAGGTVVGGAVALPLTNAQCQ